MPNTNEMRYFSNTLQLSEDAHVINTEFWKNQMSTWIEAIENNFSFYDQRNCAGSLYVGMAGVAYMYYKVLSSGIYDPGERAVLRKNGMEYLKHANSFALKHETSFRSASAFILGNPGVHAVSVAMFKRLGDHDLSEGYLGRFVSASDYLKSCRSSDPTGSNEFLVGRTGYLMGASWLSGELKYGILSGDMVNDIGKCIIEEGVQYAKSQKMDSRTPLLYHYHGSDYLGAAHGLSSVLLALLSYPRFFYYNPEAEEMVRKSVDFLLSVQTPEGNFPSSLSYVENPKPEHKELVHWCHGAPGVIYLMAKAYLYWKDEKYLKSCLLSGDLIWEKGLLKKGPGICHGIAGNGYAFLLLYRLTKDQKHLKRASAFADFILSDEFKKGAGTPDSPYSLFEGLAGTVCFIADLIQPETAAFPFMDVFNLNE